MDKTAENLDNSTTQNNTLNTENHLPTQTSQTLPVNTDTQTSPISNLSSDEQIITKDLKESSQTQEQTSTQVEETQGTNETSEIINQEKSNTNNNCIFLLI